MSKFWYAVTTPYSGLWINDKGQWLGDQLRFDTKAERDAYVYADTEGKVKAIKANQVQKRKGDSWVSSSVIYGTVTPGCSFMVLFTI